MKWNVITCHLEKLDSDNVIMMNNVVMVKNGSCCSMIQYDVKINLYLNYDFDYYE